MTTNDEAPCKYFQETCTEAGIDFESLRLLKGPSTVSRQIKQIIGQCHMTLNNSDRFLLGLRVLCADVSTLRTYLMPFPSKGGQETLSSRTTLIRILLNIDLLQVRLIEILFDYSLDFVDELSQGQNSIPKLVLDQLKYLETVDSPKEFSIALEKTIDSAQTEYQIELIQVLPEIIVDMQQTDVSIFLLRMMNDSVELAIPILDALTSLILDEVSLEKAREYAINKLAEIDLESLPVMIRFILQFSTSDNCTGIIMSLREQLDLDSIQQILHSQVETCIIGKGKGIQNKAASESLIIDTFRTAFDLQGFISETWLKIIHEFKQECSMQLLDVLVLFVAYHVPANRKKILNMFVLKLKSGVMSAEILILVAFKHYSGIKQ